MSDKRKLGPIRQLSLQSDTRNRPILKKQLSVEQLDAIEEHKPRARGIESAKNKLSDRPRPVRVAWAENRQTSHEEPVRVSRLTDPVEVKKCKEYKRPTTAKLRQQPSIEKESILCTRQELAERLRKAWKDREENKQNLDIFLTHNVQEIDFEDTENVYTEYDRVNESKHEKTEIVNVNAEYQFHNKTVQNPVVRPKNLVNSDCSYVPSTTGSRPRDIRTNISVTIPGVQNFKTMVHQNSQPESLECIKPPPEIEVMPNDPTRKEPKLVKQLSLINKENENSVIKNLPPRPSTTAASSKREHFQKRTNTAFNGSLLAGKEFRPPLTRTLSVPVKTDNIKPKFTATKRRLKPSRRIEKDEFNENSGDEIEGAENRTSKKGSRCKSAPGGELITMVSLVSPAGSDTEEVPESKKPEPKSRSTSPVKPVQSSSGSSEPPKTIQLRKTVKSVSFQQSSIHTVRSFSASFPSRRGSMAAALNSGAAFSNPHTPEREKRAPLENASSENRGPKRRLLRSSSSTSQTQNKNSFEEESTAEPDSYKLSNEALGVTKAQTSPATEISPKPKDTNKQITESSKDSNEEKKDEPDATLDDPATPKFETTKEKECWLMYKKMSDKGLPVAFDTILRGMLTPTEYRSVRKVAST